MLSPLMSPSSLAPRIIVSKHQRGNLCSAAKTAGKIHVKQHYR